MPDTTPATGSAFRTPLEASDRARTRVILVACEQTRVPDALSELATRLAAESTIRILLRCDGPESVEAGRLLTNAGVPLQALRASGQHDYPSTAERVVAMPPGTTDAELEQLGLALSDALLVIGKPDRNKELQRKAAEYGKPVVVLGDDGPTQLKRPNARIDTLPEIKQAAAELIGSTENADASVLAPALLRKRWLRWLVRSPGAVDQILLGFFALGQEHEPDPRRLRLRRATAPFRDGWRPRAYFAPEGWAELCPDAHARDPGARLKALFDELDVQATVGARLHRDGIWMIHAAAALAVFAAVAGHIHLAPFGEGHGWGWTEVVALAFIALSVFQFRASRLHVWWTGTRFAAEQLRVALLCLPLLVVPPLLDSPDRATSGRSDPFLNTVKRAVRRQGLPRLDDASPRAARHWLKHIVADQARYHRDNSHRIEAAEKGLELVSAVFFVIAFLAALLHIPEEHWDALLLATAAGPALVASLHGAATRLGLKQRACESEAAAEDLDEIMDGLQEPTHTGTQEDEWRRLRELARKAAEVMGGENERWRRLIRAQSDNLPA
jgi:hypothetical protein